MIEDGVIPGDEWQLANPVQALRSIAKDPTLQATVERKDGRRLTACELQWHYLDAAKAYLKDREQPLAGRGRLGGGAGPARGRPLKARPGPSTGRPSTSSCSRSPTATASLGGRQAGPGRPPVPRRAWTRACTTGWRRPARSSAGRRAGRSPKRWPSPRRRTRAFFTGRCLARYAPQIAAAGIGAIIFDIGRETLRQVPCSSHPGHRHTPRPSSTPVPP